MGGWRMITVLWFYTHDDNVRGGMVTTDILSQLLNYFVTFLIHFSFFSKVIPHTISYKYNWNLSYKYKNLVPNSNRSIHQIHATVSYTILYEIIKVNNIVTDYNNIFVFFFNIQNGKGLLTFLEHRKNILYRLRNCLHYNVDLEGSTSRIYQNVI